jgi:hypothetical protein
MVELGCASPMTKWLPHSLRLLSLVLIFLVTLVPPSGLAQVGVLDSRTFCVPMEVHGGAPIEEPCLNELKEVVKRDGHVLTLKLENGKTKIIRDSRECNSPDQEALCVSYRLVGYIGDKQFIVAVQPYECGSVLLVNRRTGKETVLLGWPILSPNKQRLVVTSSSVAGECNPAYAVAIFSLVNDLPQLEWQSGPPGDIGDYEYDGWDGDNRVLLRTETDGKYRTTHHLTLTAQGWKLTDQRGN